jgi:Rod binding domain-containing protein
MSPIASVSAVDRTPETDPDQIRLTKAARELEGVFLTHMLKNLEKTSRIDGGRGGGASAYGTMVVEAMANAVSAGGGIGLAEVILENISHQP